MTDTPTLPDGFDELEMLLFTDQAVRDSAPTVLPDGYWLLRRSGLLSGPVDDNFDDEGADAVGDTSSDCIWSRDELPVFVLTGPHAMLRPDHLQAFEALRAFKAYVHARLDAAGIPTHPGGPHSEAGCRIGDRLDLALRARTWATFDTAPRCGRRILALTGAATVPALRPYAFRPFVVRCVSASNGFEDWTLFPGYGVSPEFFTHWTELDLPPEAQER